MNNLNIRKAVLITSALVAVLISFDFLVRLIAQKIYAKNREMELGELLNLVTYKYLTIHLVCLSAFIILYIILGKKLHLKNSTRLLLCLIGYVFCAAFVKLFI